MKKLLYLLLFLAASVHCEAQAHTIDSLKQILNTSQPDSNRVKTYRWLAYNYEATSPDSALIYASAGIRLGHRLGFTPGEARCLRVKGDILETLGNYTGSLEAYLASLKLFEQLGDETNQAVVYTCIGILYKGQDDYEEALKNTLRAHDLILHSNDRRELTTTLANMGYFYYKLKRNNAALQYEQQAYQMAIDSAQPEYLSNIQQTWA